MDTVTHGITGALVGKAFFADPAERGRPATVALTLGAVFPDSDVFFELFAPNELATLEWHRGVTHSFVALPAPPTLLRWSGLILTPGGVYHSYFGLNEARAPAFEFVASASPNRYLAIAERLPSVKTFRWFARFPVVRYRTEGVGSGQVHIIEYTDLRFTGGVLRRRRNPPAFTYRVLINAAGEVVSAGFVAS